LKRLFFITAILIWQVAYGQIHYTKVHFVKGMPSQIKAKWDKSEYAEIKVGKYYKNLFIICKNTDSFSNSMYFALIYPDYSYDITNISLNRTSKNKFETKIRLNSPAEDELSPLNLNIYPDKKIVEYNWGDSASGYSSAPKIVKEYRLKVGKQFPSLSLNSSSGAFNIDSLAGKIVVINWWATSCVACVEEMPELNRLVEKYKGKSVEFLAIIDDKENLEKFLKDHSFEYKQLYGDAATEKLLGGAFPRNIIISKNHKILYNKFGANTDTWKLLDKIISKNL
jgi:thiol-disulfide isomerase/thioredoxin